MTEKGKGKKSAGAAEKTASVYIEMIKGDETIKVHETQVEQHQRLGWSVKE